MPRTGAKLNRKALDAERNRKIALKEQKKILFKKEAEEDFVLREEARILREKKEQYDRDVARRLQEEAEEEADRKAKLEEAKSQWREQVCDGVTAC